MGDDVINMIVALSKIREDGTGSIEIYEIDSNKFNDELVEIAPSSEEDWWNLADFVEKEGKLIFRVSPDYTIRAMYE